MDPLSAAFASYLDLVSTQITRHMTDTLGTEIQAVVVKHKGIRIPYSYQIWQIRPKSVCSSYRHNTLQFSKCTLAAQSLFQDTCAYLQAHPQEHWKYHKLTNMYCLAAESYQPTIANMQWTPEQSLMEQAQTECNLAVTALMNDPSAENEKKKAAACLKHQSLKAKGSNQ
jgi:hypothetical protein